MANPQPDQHTRIANELLDHIPRFKFNGSQLRIIMVIWRNTYGWKRKEHAFAIKFMMGATGLSDRTIKKELAGLIQANVIIVTREETNIEPRYLSFNKDYEQWDIPRSGEYMDGNMEFEVNDTSPPPENLEVNNSSPPVVNNSSPQSGDFAGLEVNDCSPKERKKILKKSFKENVVSMFEKFYSIYPRRVSRHAALTAWNKLSKESSFDPELIIRNTENFAKTCQLLETPKQYIVHPSTYLNQKRYADYEVVDPEGIAAENQSKLDSNIDFFRSQYLGGDRNGQESGRTLTSESQRSLPEQGTGFSKEPSDI